MLSGYGSISFVIKVFSAGWGAIFRIASRANQRTRCVAMVCKLVRGRALLSPVNPLLMSDLGESGMSSSRAELKITDIHWGCRWLSIVPSGNEAYTSFRTSVYCHLEDFYLKFLLYFYIDSNYRYISGNSSTLVTNTMNCTILGQLHLLGGQSGPLCNEASG